MNVAEVNRALTDLGFARIGKASEPPSALVSHRYSWYSDKEGYIVVHVHEDKDKSASVKVVRTDYELEYLNDEIPVNVRSERTVDNISDIANLRKVIEGLRL